MDTEPDIVEQLRGVVAMLEHEEEHAQHESLAAVMRQGEDYRHAARKLRHIATMIDRQCADLLARHSVPGALTSFAHDEPIRVDRVVPLGSRRVPVRVETTEPIELIALSPGSRDSNTPSVSVELHNPASEPYHVHGTMLFIGEDGHVLAHDDFVVDVLNPLRTKVHEHSVPPETDRLDLVVIASVAG